MIIWLICFSAKGYGLCQRIAHVLNDCECKIFSKTSAETGAEEVRSVEKWTEKAFGTCDGIVFVGSLGIAVRHISPFLKSKVVDPAVVDLDDNGKFCISVLSGHIGGANDLTKRIAAGIGSVPVITTATDVNGKFSVDVFAVKNDMYISSMAKAKDVSARVLDGRFVGLYSDFVITGMVPPELTSSDTGELGIDITIRTGQRPFSSTLSLVPRCCVLGIGCKKGTSKEAIEQAVTKALTNGKVCRHSVRAIASVDLKKDEPGLLEYARGIGVPAIFYTSDELNSLVGNFSASEFVKSVTGVDCVCERAALRASRDGWLLIRKSVSEGVTVAVAMDDVKVRIGGDI
jgi:cobalt-precorrin 5A hydrolase